MYRYPVEVRETREGVSVRVQGVAHVTGRGRTLAEALDSATEALNSVIESAIAEGRAPPEPVDDGAGGAFVAPASRLQAALLFARHRQARSTAELQRALLTSSWVRVDELGKGANITLDRADRAARATGHRLVLMYVPNEGPSP